MMADQVPLPVKEKGAAAVQTAPVFLDREATIDKISLKVKEAKDNGADLVAPAELKAAR